MVLLKPSSSSKWDDMLAYYMGPPLFATKPCGALTHDSGMFKSCKLQCSVDSVGGDTIRCIAG